MYSGECVLCSQVRLRAGGSQGGVEKRLMLIPLMFVLLRMWGTIQFFFSIATSSLNQGGCVPPWMQTVYLVLGILQVVCVCVYTHVVHISSLCACTWKLCNTCGL